MGKKEGEDKEEKKNGIEEIELDIDYLKKKVCISKIGLFLQEQYGCNKDKAYIVENVCIQVPNLKIFRSLPKELNNNESSTIKQEQEIIIPPQISGDIIINQIDIKMHQDYYRFMFELYSSLSKNNDKSTKTRILSSSDLDSMQKVEQETKTTKTKI